MRFVARVFSVIAILMLFSCSGREENILSDSEKQEECGFYVRVIGLDDSSAVKAASDMVSEALEIAGMLWETSSDVDLSLLIGIAEDNASLPYCGYSVSRKGNAALLVARDPTALRAAAEYLISEIQSGAVLTENENVTGVAAGAEIFSCLPETSVCAVSNVANGVGEVILSGITFDDYFEYVGQISESGFSDVSDWSLGGNMFNLFSDGTYTVNTAYYSGTREAVITLREENYVAAIPDGARHNCSPIITFSSSGDVLIVRLADGSFLVCGDGDDGKIFDILREQSPDGGEAVVSLWLGINHEKNLPDGIVLQCSREIGYRGFEYSLDGAGVVWLDEEIYIIQIEATGERFLFLKNEKELEKFGELPEFSAVFSKKQCQLAAENYVYPGVGESGAGVYYAENSSIVFTLPIGGQGSGFAVLPK